MAKIRGSYGLSTFIAPLDSNDEYPTHKELYGEGGYRSVANISERDAIPAKRKKEGMLVNVIDENKVYQLKNGQWELFSVDLSNYYNKAEADAKINEKVDQKIKVISQTDYDALQTKDATCLYFITA